jgi:hypothetical protein
MAHVITFSAAHFDVTKEPPNPINPIAGHSVLQWLREKLVGSPYTTTAPAAEDWGWYMSVRGAGAAYLVGAGADADTPPGKVEWAVQIHKQRSLIDKITGANKMTADDPLSALIEQILRADPEVDDIDTDLSA